MGIIEAKQGCKRRNEWLTGQYHSHQSEWAVAAQQDNDPEDHWASCIHMLLRLLDIDHCVPLWLTGDDLDILGLVGLSRVWLEVVRGSWLWWVGSWRVGSTSLWGGRVVLGWRVGSSSGWFWGVVGHRYLGSGILCVRWWIPLRLLEVWFWVFLLVRHCGSDIVNKRNARNNC
jgi:hypothetical protein